MSQEERSEGRLRWFLNLSCRGKLFLAFGLLLILLGTLIGITYRNLTAIQESQKKILEKDFVTAVTLTEVRARLNLQRARALELVAMTSRAQQESVAGAIRAGATDVDALLSMLVRLAEGNRAFLQRLDDLKALLASFRHTREEAIALAMRGEVEKARQMFVSIQDERFEKMRAITLELGEAAGGEARQSVARAEKQTQESVRLSILIGVVALLLGGGLSVSLSRVIADPLRQISGVAESIASGNLTVRVSSNHRKDEVGILGQSFHRMVESLRELNREVQDGVNVLASAASEIVASTAQVASGAGQTATAVSETTTTVEEVKQTANLSSQKAKYVSDTAQRSAQISQAGRKAVEETIAGMNRIRSQMDSIAESIVQLSEQSRAIGEITATVNDLAEQSNLLAVNAAIEAAKAGEHGKGFSVVAQEVKSLAEQSKQATAQVRSLLSDIQKATSAAVMATEQGAKAVEAGVKQSLGAGESLHLLAETITEAAQAATQIAASSQQQLVGMDQVASAMESVKLATAQNVAGTKQAETAAHNLQELGQKLKQVVQRYRVQ